VAPRVRTLPYSYALVASFAAMLVSTPIAKAQTFDPADGVTFDDRFFIDGQIAPAFTRPEVMELFSTATPLAPNETVATEATTQYSPGPLSRMILAEPKGPAKVLKDLLNTPVNELLVTRAEAGPDVPPPPSGQAPAELAATQPGAVMARAAEPISERPTGGDVTNMPPPRAAASIREGGDLPGEHASEHRSAANFPQEVAASPRATEHAEPLRPEQPAVRSDQRNPGQSMARADPQPARSTDVRGRLVASDTPMRNRRIARGRAAWYEHPGRTASGETFDPNQRTAAHHSLPLGTKVRVVSEKTGRSVIVRINDRIPRKTKILIDLSRASARAIGMVGTDTVSLYAIGRS
jgi:rare lipoprotein A